MQGTEFSIGADPSCCNLVLQNDYISKRQVTVSFTEGGYTVVDHGSTNGTTLNGVKLQPNRHYPMRSGDRLILANEIVDLNPGGLQMNYLIAAQTDIGPVKKTNQDSYCIQTARSKRYGNLLFAVVCDGMGGLKKARWPAQPWSHALQIGLRRACRFCSASAQWILHYCARNGPIC